MSRWALVLLCFLPAAAWSDPVEFTYTIVTTGTGPGVMWASAHTQVELTNLGRCVICGEDPEMSNCLDPSGSSGVILWDVAGVPVGGVNVTGSFSGGPGFRGTGTWGYVTAKSGCGGCQLCPGLCGGGETGSGESPNGSFVGRIPVSGDYGVTVGMVAILGACSPMVCGRCMGKGCCGKGADQWSLDVQYLKQSGSVPKSCVEAGTGSVEADGLWHAVGGAGCMHAPDVAAGWAVTLTSVAGDRLAEGKMVADTGNPWSGSGPNLIVRAIALQPCPPNCPPSDACLACVRSGHTIAECRASGACPANCPPYCPPPPGCPADPSKCPPPPKCPPYCPPPPGCPEDPSLCPKGCPPICPPPPGCPEDLAKCPEPPGGCPPDCPTQPPDQPCLTVAGTVLFHGGVNQVVEGATVTLNRQGQPPPGVTLTATTDASGHYEITVPEAGTYEVLATKGTAVGTKTAVVLGEPVECPVSLSFLLSCKACSQPVALQYQYQCNPDWCCRSLDCLAQDMCDCRAVNCVPGHKTCPKTPCSTRSFCAAGCLLMCVAMIADWDPVELNRMLTVEGAILRDGGLVLNNHTAGLLGWDSVADQPYDEQVLLQELCDPGLAVIADVGGHFVVVAGHESDGATRCRFRVADPGTIYGEHFLDQYGVSRLRVICKSECIEF